MIDPEASSIVARVSAAPGSRVTSDGITMSSGAAPSTGCARVKASHETTDAASIGRTTAIPGERSAQRFSTPSSAPSTT
jgi:hypothetical protein